MRFAAVYHVRSNAASIESRARAIAVEQSVEMPLDAIDKQRCWRISSVGSRRSGFRRRGSRCASRSPPDRWPGRRPIVEHAVRQYLAA